MRRALVLAVLAAAIAGCVRNPVTGRRQLTLISEEQEIELGRQSAQQIAQSIGLARPEALQDYVAKLGLGLARSSERPELPWSFQVLDDPTVNAFALPGGWVFVTRGMLTHMNSEAELAAVVGHEIGHITARHAVQLLSRAQLAQLGLGVGMILVPELQRFGQLAGVGMQLLFLKYGRDAERQSDELGFLYMLEAGYDVREMAEVFETLGQASEAAGQGSLPQWLSTHPNPENRVEATRERAEALEGVALERLRTEREAYLRRLEGVVFGANPRQGFFRDGRFLHPELRFQMQFPDGWQTQNLPAAVVARSQEGDAAMQLAISSELTPEQAASQFLGQQGIEAGAPSRGQVGGNPSLSAPFTAETEQGVLQGLVTFFAHGGRTFGVLGVAPQGGLSRLAPGYERALSSFSTLTDPSILAVQPARLQLVQVPRELTLEQFHAQNPSTVPLETLRLINGLSPGEPIPAGTLVKRVVGGTPAGPEAVGAR